MSFGDGDLHITKDELEKKVSKLEITNGKLCAEINRQERRIRELEAQLAERGAVRVNDGRHGMPVMSSDGRRYVSIAVASRAVAARDGCGDERHIQSNISTAIKRGGGAYGVKWRRIDACRACPYVGVPGACPTEWSWPEYGHEVCRLRGGAE